MDRKFYNEEIHHVYNRGVDKRRVFIDVVDYERFLACLVLLNDQDVYRMVRWRDFNRKQVKQGVSEVRPLEFRALNLGACQPLVKIISYCLNPNHFHLILKQISEKGIALFMQKLGTAYTMYFNKRHNRSGSLFQGKFKNALIDDDQLLFLSVYVSCNHLIHGYEEGFGWQFQSHLEYLGESNENFCEKSIILDQFGKNKKEQKDFYKKFCLENAEFLKEKKEFLKKFLE
ncbi:MAG: transposase [Patescibacteria group bacterium]|nr:transposase [Patescibacteria group bacterium]